MEHNEWLEKMNCFRDRVQQDPDNGKLWLRYAVFLEHECENPDMTVRAYENASRLLPDIDLRLPLGAAYVTAERETEGFALLQGVVREKPTALAFYMLAFAYWQCEKLDEAENACLRSLELEPDYEEAFFLLGDIYRETSRERAIENYRKAIAIDPEYQVAWRSLGRELIHMENLEEALRSLERALQLDPDDGWSHLYYANALWREKRMREAEIHYRKAIECFPEFAGAHRLYAGFLAGTGRTSEAEEQRAEARRKEKEIEQPPERK